MTGVQTCALPIFIENNKIFSMQHGEEYLYEELMDYLRDEELIIHVDDASEEEYTSNLEGRNVK